MANQKAMMKWAHVVNGQPARNVPPRDLRVVLVDTDATASTFTDIGAATTWVADDEYLLVDVIGQGTTAPATATAFQFNVNGNDIGAFLNGAAVYDPTSQAAARCGSAYLQKIRKGSSIRIIGRA